MLQILNTSRKGEDSTCGGGILKLTKHCCKKVFWMGKEAVDVYVFEDVLPLIFSKVLFDSLNLVKQMLRPIQK